MSFIRARKSGGTNRVTRSTKKIASEIRELTCGRVMLAAHEVDEMDSIDYVVKLLAAKDWDHVWMTNFKRPENKKYEGLSVAAVSEGRGLHPVDTM